MSSATDRGWLPDVNVWLALCSERHEHHTAANEWRVQVASPLYFCRVTQMGLLRLLTNRKVMGGDVQTPEQAIGIFRQLLRHDQVLYADEPGGTEELWMSLMTSQQASVGHWTDAWLAAVSMRLGSGLVSFDAGMQRWPALRVS